MPCILSEANNNNSHFSLTIQLTSTKKGVMAEWVADGEEKKYGNAPLRSKMRAPKISQVVGAVF
jgi:hypothetical protein